MNMHRQEAAPAIGAILSPARRANLARLLAPRHIAFVGGRFAEMALRSLRKHDFAGEVHVVNPGRDEIAGHKCYKTLADLPVAPDAVYLAVPAEATSTRRPARANSLRATASTVGERQMLPRQTNRMRMGPRTGTSNDVAQG